MEALAEGLYARQDRIVHPALLLEIPWPKVVFLHQSVLEQRDCR